MADTKHHGGGDPHGQPPKWDAEIDIRQVVKTGVWLFGITAVSFVLMWFLYAGLRGHLRKQDPPRSPLPEANVRQLPAEPRLQFTAEKDLAAVRAQEAELLNRYGLVEGAPGKAAIPIDRAMELVAARYGGVSAPPAAAAPVVPAPAAAPAHGGGH